MPLQDAVNGFCQHGLVTRAGAADGPLANLTFALKDAFDVAGIPTGNGSPDWLASHPIPTASAPVVDLLLGAGARMAGKVQMDEMAWSLIGQNAHYGTPINVNAPDQVPGGSSSGSAAVVAAKLVDFAIGSDTGGSVRLPASFCGIYGMRPTHGRIPNSGSAPLAPSYDTVGWFARNASLMARVGQVLLGKTRSARKPSRLLIARDLFDATDSAASTMLLKQVDHLADRIRQVIEIDIAEGKLAEWVETFVAIQSHEVWATHGSWVQAAKPKFGPGIADRFNAASKLSMETLEWALAARERIRARLDSLLADEAVIVLPTSPGIAPLRDSSAASLQDFRMRAVQLLCVAGHAGLPQISMPLAADDGCPLGLSVIAARNCDEDILQLAMPEGS
jgi:amidase